MDKNGNIIKNNKKTIKKEIKDLNKIKKIKDL